ncbi:MAG: hypothetical protein HKN87_23140 [Saprospiraceae bacterium]|nr:hypothetical protein [Saprospiraceae bacterium]
MTRGFISTLLLLLLFSLDVSSQCTHWFPFNEGSTFEYTFFSKKDKQTGRVSYVVSEVTKQGGNFTAEVDATFFDKKDKNYNEFSFQVECVGGTYRANVSNFINPTLTESFGSMEVNYSGDDLVMPKELQVGMELPDANSTMQAEMGIMNIKMEMRITGRKVIDKVQITTPIKTFETYKITAQEHIKMTMLNRTSSSTYFYAEGYGQVKSETYDKNGKLSGYMLLTKFE